MFAAEEIRPGRITVGEFALSPGLGLDVEVILGGAGMGQEIHSPRIQKSGLALAGYTAYVHPDRVQLLTGSEVSHLQAPERGEYRQALRRLEPLQTRCIVITRAAWISRKDSWTLHAERHRPAEDAGTEFCRDPADRRGA